MNKKQEANAFVKECITQALFELLQKQSFESITITDLTKRAGVGRVSFYRNYESKEDVIRQLLLQLIGHINSKLPKSPDLSTMEPLLRDFRNYQDLFAILQNAGLSHITMSCLSQAYGPKPEQSNEEAYINAFLFHGIYGMIEEWFRRGVKEDPVELIEMLKEWKCEDI